MRRLALQLWDAFYLRDPHRRARKPARRPVNRRLEVEALELRAVPTANNIAGTLIGTAFVDHNADGVLSAGDATLPGVTVTLSGTTYLGTSIDTSTATGAGGQFQFLNVPRGTYQLSAGSISGYLGGSLTFGNVHGPAGVDIVSGVPVAPGHDLNAAVSVRGLAPDSVWLGQFLSTSTSADLPSGTAGAGSAAASGPFVKTAISDVTLTNGGSSQTIDLLAHFSAPDLGTSMVRLNTALGAINLDLFDQQAPQTVQNFIDYIESGKYANTIFHRRTDLTKDGLAVLQGGGFTFTSGTSTTLPSVTAFPNVADEVGAANTPGTIAMAKGSSSGSANSQFFFNLSDNTNVLSPQNQTNGGFTVFGKIADAASQNVVNELAAFTVHNESSANSAMNEIPLKGSFTDNDSNFPSKATASDFALITSAQVISRNESLTYTVTSSNTHAVTATLGSGDPERLTLAPVQIGTATITVTATDQFGQTASTTFKVTVGGTNTAPVVNSVTLSPTSPTPADTITATVTDSDAQNNPITLTYVWQVTPTGSSTPTTVMTTSHSSSLTDTLKPSDLHTPLQAGDKITVTVTPNDGLLDGTPVVTSVDITT
jgi:cyclophilin family peptidyl-prolyl cis-trans isomerase